MLRKHLLQQSRALSRSLTQTPSYHGIRSHLPTASRPAQSSLLPSISVARRWQSTESSTQTDSNATQSQQETPTSDSKSSATEAENPLKAELEKKNKEVIDLKDKYLRSVAEFRNLQDRTKRDMDSTRQFAIQRFAADLLDSIDNLDRALGSVPAEALGKASGGATSNTSSTDANKAAATESSSSTPNKDLLNLHSGLRMTESILLSTLKKHGLERFDPMEGEGRKFDPNTDEATFFTKVEGKEDGQVFYTQSKGFKLNGRVIRAAKVGVVKNT